MLSPRESGLEDDADLIRGVACFAPPASFFHGYAVIT